MAFPTNPTNGQTANVGGIVYVYNSSTTAWTVSTNFSGNAVVNQLTANSVISATSLGATAFTGDSIAITGNISGATLTLVGAATIGGNITSASIIPGANATHDLGTASSRWRNIYTSDLHLNNGIGNWTIVEGEEDLFLHNNRNGKVYKFALTEVDPAQSPPKQKAD